jgi:hypothetical protein
MQPPDNHALGPLDETMVIFDDAIVILHHELTLKVSSWTLSSIGCKENAGKGQAKAALILHDSVKEDGDKGRARRKPKCFLTWCKLPVHKLTNKCLSSSPQRNPCI